MKNAQRDYYLTILELEPGASLQEVKAAYRELCLIWHPDKNPVRVSERATKKLQLLNEAYQWLMQYGNLRDDAPPQTASPPQAPVNLSDDPAAHHSWWQQLGAVWQKIFQHALQLVQTPNSQDISRLLTIEELDFSNTTIKDLTPIQSFRNLRKLECDNTPITDLSPLRNLHELRELDCWNTPITSLEPLAQLTQLQRLNCNNTQIDTLEPLRNLVNLRQLSCSGTAIRTLEPLQQLVNIENLSCGETLIESLAPLQQLTQLHVLYCSQTPITSIHPLRQLPNLRSVYCVDTQVSLYELGRFKTENPHCTVSY